MQKKEKVGLYYWMIILLKKIKKAVNDMHWKMKIKKSMKKEKSSLGIEGDILLLAHSLEKGMGLPSPRPKFGLEKAIMLLNILENYVKSGHDVQSFAFKEGVSVLEKYFEFTKNDCSFYINRFQRINKMVESKNLAGVFEIQNVEDIYKKIDEDQIKYFIKSRHSIRSFLPTVIDKKILSKVIELANCAPSACNRQPIKVYWTANDILIRQITELVPGNKGFEDEIPNWVLITSNRNMFGRSESLQWYINGGIYLSYFVEALHTYKIGSCIFQIPATNPNTSALRKIASIPDNEAIIAAVGFGYPKAENKFLAAERKPVEEVLVNY